MAIFRRGQTTCPKCGKEKRVETQTKEATWEGACSCGERLFIVYKSDYWVGYRDPAGKYRRKKIGPIRRSAERVLAKVQTEINEGLYVNAPTEQKNITLSELIEMYEKNMQHRQAKNTEERKKYTFALLKESFGENKYIHQISKGDIEKFMAARLAKKKKLSTIRENVHTLSTLLKWAIEKGLLKEKPTVKINIPKETRAKFISKKEARILISRCKDSHPYLHYFIRIALATGMRRNEVTNLSLSWVDWDTNTITVPAEIAKTKTQRRVPISMECEITIVSAKGKFNDHDPLIPTPSQGTLYREWRNLCKEIGIWPLRIHDLRHTAASWMVQAGVDLYTVGQILGHSDYQTTQIYAHLAPQNLNRAIKHTAFEDLSDPHTLSDPVVDIQDVIESRRLRDLD